MIKQKEDKEYTVKVCLDSCISKGVFPYREAIVIARNKKEAVGRVFLEGKLGPLRDLRLVEIKENE